MSKKELTFHINNMAYTLEVDEEMEKEICKHLDLNKNNDTKALLYAYLMLMHEYKAFKKEVEDITNKLAGF